MTTPTYNREGITVDSVSAVASPGTPIVRSCGITIVNALSAGDNIGASLVLPDDADVGDLVEVYNVYTGGNPTQNSISVYPDSGETVNFDTNPISIAAKGMKRFRKIDPTSWFGS